MFYLHLLLVVLNMLFYISYPKSLAISLLIAILEGKFTFNVKIQGMQMLPAIRVSYECIKTKWLNLW